MEEARSEEAFRVSVKTLDGKIHHVEVTSETTIAEFKAKIQNITNVSASLQRLIFQGKVLKDEQTVGSYGIRAGLTLHMVERPPEAAAAAAPAPGPTGGVPTTGGVPQVRPASIMMGTITLPNQAGGTPPGLDNLINSVLSSLGVPMGATSIRVTTTTPPFGQPPNENAVWGPLESIENHLQQVLNSIQGSDAAAEASPEPQGRAARRLMATDSLLERLRPVLRRLAQAADTAPGSEAYQGAQQLLTQSSTLFQQLASYFAALGFALRQPPAATARSGDSTGAPTQAGPIPAAQVQSFPFMFPPAGRGQPGQVPGRQPGVQHFPFPFMSFQQPQQSQPSQQPQQFQPSQQPQQSQPSTQGQEQQAPHIGQSTAQQNPQANVALSQLMSQLMPAIAPLAQQLAQAASGSPQSSQSGAPQLNINQVLAQAMQALSTLQQTPQQTPPPTQQSETLPQQPTTSQQSLNASDPPIPQPSASTAPSPSTPVARAQGPSAPLDLNSLFGNMLQSLSQPPSSAGGTQAERNAPPTDIGSLFSSLLATPNSTSQPDSDRDRIINILTQAAAVSKGSLADVLRGLGQSSSSSSTGEDDTVLGELLEVVLSRLEPAEMLAILQGNLAPAENLRGPIAAYLRRHANIEHGEEVNEEQLWGLKEEIVGALAVSMDDSSLPAEITSKMKPGAALTPAALEVFSLHVPELLRLILLPADPSPVVPHPFAAGLCNWSRNLSVELVSRLADCFSNGISDVPSFIRFFLLSRLSFIPADPLRQSAAELITTHVMGIYSQSQVTNQIREAQTLAQSGQRNASRRQREEEEEEGGIPSSWRRTLAEDAMRQANSPAPTPLSECYLSGSLAKPQKRQKQTEH